MKKNRITALLISASLLISGCSSGGESGDTTDNENDNTNSAQHVAFNYSQLPMGGGGFVSGLITNPAEEGLIYARTDVGGAYKWNKSTEKWECLSYGISEEDRGLLSIDGLATSKSEPNRLYMIAGCSYFSNGKTSVFISDDYGATFDVVEVTDLITVHGNGYGRQNGERIAVDPKNADIVYIGGRSGGLIRSTDGGKTWERVDSFEVRRTPNGNGINSIVFDNEDSNIIYVGVSETGKENVYVTKNGGESWDTVKGLPTDVMPMRMEMDSAGNLLINCADNEGPGEAAKGGIYKVDKSGNVTDISPEGKLPIGDVTADYADPDKLVACTINTWMQQSNGAYGDLFYTSTDGGKTWRTLNDNMTMDANGCDWVAPYAIHWCGSLILSGTKMMVCSGNGIFAVDNVWADTADFYFCAQGLEETVPLDIVSVKDGPLVTAVGDYDGCVYDDITTYGKLHTKTVGSCSGIAVGGENSQVWAKVGTDSSKVTMLISEDGGETWKAAKNVEKSGIAAGGKVAVSADGKTIFWSPENKHNTYYTTDMGKTWTACQGLLGNLQIVCDPVNPDYVYAAGSGQFSFSKDGGKTFTSSTSMISGQRFCVVPSKEKTVVAPFGSCIGISEDGGESFNFIKTLNKCTAVGVGAGKTADSPYVIYIWGAANGGEIGLYMSEDLGQTWVSISDEQHQFGGPGNGMFVAGDANVYGRVYMSSVGLGVIVGNIAE